MSEAKQSVVLFAVDAAAFFVELEREFRELRKALGAAPHDVAVRALQRLDYLETAASQLAAGNLARCGVCNELMARDSGEELDGVPVCTACLAEADDAE